MPEIPLTEAAAWALIAAGTAYAALERWGAPAGLGAIAAALVALATKSVLLGA